MCVCVCVRVRAWCVRVRMRARISGNTQRKYKQHVVGASLAPDVHSAVHSDGTTITRTHTDLYFSMITLQIPEGLVPSSPLLSNDLLVRTKQMASLEALHDFHRLLSVLAAAHGRIEVPKLHGRLSAMIFSSPEDALSKQTALHMLEEEWLQNYETHYENIASNTSKTPSTSATTTPTTATTTPSTPSCAAAALLLSPVRV